MPKQNLLERANSPVIPTYKGLRMPALADKVQMSPAWIYERIRQGAFPAPIKLGHSSIWIESEVDQWFAEQIQQSRDFEKKVRDE